MTQAANRAAAITPRMSVLDRLLMGDAPEPQGRTAQARRMREAVRRDIENLFTTRPPCRSWPRILRELDRSILSFGLPDLQTRTVVSDGSREALRAEVEAVIRIFEPRLRDASVELATPANPYDRSMRFRIHGRLVLEAGVEAVVYDSQIDPASRELSIARAERDREA